MNVFRKSKTKVTAMIMFCIIIILIAAILIRIFTKSIIYEVIFIVFGILYLFLSMPKLKSLYNQTLKIGGSIIFNDVIMKTEMEFAEIESIKYSGIKFIPMSEMMIVKSKYDTIYIDFNFINYLDIWRSVIIECSIKNANIDIDKKLYKRLKLDER